MLPHSSLSPGSRASGSEVGYVREHGRQVRVLNAEPFGERGAVLIHGGSGDPAAVVARIVGAAEREGRELAVDVAALNSAADDEMIPPQA